MKNQRLLPMEGGSGDEIWFWAMAEESEQAFLSTHWSERGWVMDWVVGLINVILSFIKKKKDE